MRGFSDSVIRLITPPLPAASRPSKITTTRRPFCLIHSCSFTSSIWSLASSLAYFHFFPFRSPSAAFSARSFFAFMPAPFPAGGRRRPSASSSYSPPAGGESAIFSAAIAASAAATAASSRRRTSAGGAPFRKIQRMQSRR